MGNEAGQFRVRKEVWSRRTGKVGHGYEQKTKQKGNIVTERHQLRSLKE